MLFSHFKSYSVMADFNQPDALREWRDLKLMVINEAYFTMGFSDFWTHLIVHYNSEIRYAPVTD